ncbi:MAG TPA: 8-oxo-dGTP diphosphatase MutT [Verrucomicrobiae bacterium]|nr:8-oxo-dGTP diphosphatase MutT [Verrucomicrobiae bacterium]
MQASGQPSRKSVEVAAGLVFREGRLLITRRLPGTHLAGLWEFPGGKREPGESIEECLRRELLEELGVDVEVGALFQEVSHDYPEKTVHLKFLLCRLPSGEPQPIGCAALAWVGPNDLDRYQFPPADAVLLDRLRAAENIWK